MISQKKTCAILHAWDKSREGVRYGRKGPGFSRIDSKVGSQSEPLCLPSSHFHNLSFLSFPLAVPYPINPQAFFPVHSQTSFRNGLCSPALLPDPQDSLFSPWSDSTSVTLLRFFSPVTSWLPKPRPSFHFACPPGPPGHCWPSSLIRKALLPWLLSHPSLPQHVL